MVFIAKQVFQLPEMTDIQAFYLVIVTVQVNKFGIPAHIQLCQLIAKAVQPFQSCVLAEIQFGQFILITG